MSTYLSQPGKAIGCGNQIESEVRLLRYEQVHLSDYLDNLLDGRMDARVSFWDHAPLQVAWPRDAILPCHLPSDKRYNSANLGLIELIFLRVSLAGLIGQILKKGCKAVKTC